MRAAIVRPNDASPAPADICIVIDVLRATTTASVLCNRLGELCVLRTPADLDQLPVRSGGYALFSELVGIESDIPRFDNSPILARDTDLAGRTPVLITTNGTLAVGVAVGFAREVVLGSFINLSAVVDYVRQRGVATVSIMPAGNINKDQRCVEDDACAESIAARLSPDASHHDLAAVIAACHVDPRIVRRRANEPNLGADLELCFSVDAVPIVPRIVVAKDQRWFGVVQASAS